MSAVSTRKDDLLVEYATYGLNTNLFVSKYELYLPNKEELRKLINQSLEKKILKKIKCVFLHREIKK